MADATVAEDGETETTILARDGAVDFFPLTLFHTLSASTAVTGRNASHASHLSALAGLTSVQLHSHKPASFTSLALSLFTLLSPREVISADGGAANNAAGIRVVPAVGAGVDDSGIDAAAWAEMGVNTALLASSEDF